MKTKVIITLSDGRNSKIAVNANKLQTLKLNMTDLSASVRFFDLIKKESYKINTGIIPIAR